MCVHVSVHMLTSVPEHTQVCTHKVGKGDRNATNVYPRQQSVHLCFSFIHSRMFTEHGQCARNSKQVAPDIKAISLEIKMTCSATMSLTTCFSGTE